MAIQDLLKLRRLSPQMTTLVDSVLTERYKEIQWSWPLLQPVQPPPCFVRKIRISQFPKDDEDAFSLDAEYGWLSNMISVDLLNPNILFRFDLLAHCENVTVIHCNWITKVPEALRRLKKLSLHKCVSLRDITNVEGIPCVEIHDCNQIVDFSPLGKSHSVCVWDCTGFPRDCLVLYGVKNVNLGKLSSLKSLDGLQKADTVEIFSCESILDPWPLNRVPQVSLITMNLRGSLAFLANSTAVNLDNCVVPQGLHGLNSGEGVKFLHIYDCFVPGVGLQTIYNLPHCSHLSICDQPYILDISHFTGLEYLELSNCKNMTTIPRVIDTNAQVSIKGCPLISDNC